MIEQPFLGKNISEPNIAKETNTKIYKYIQ